MNERQFLREINHRSNDTGSFTYAQVKQFIEENSKPSVDRKVSIFAKLFKLRQKTVKEIIEDNFEHLIDRCCDDYVGELLILLWDNEDTKDILGKKFGHIVERFKGNKLFEDDELLALGIQEEKFLRQLSKTDEGKELIKSNFEEILDCTPKNHLFEVTQNMKKISSETEEILDQYLRDNSYDVAKSLLYNRRIAFHSGIHQLVDDYTDTILIMIEELLKSENARWVDIRSLGSGGYSCVYQIGDKVLKIGANRGTYHMPNHTRILQPLTRTSLIDERNNNTPFAVVEVADRVDKLSYEDYKEENLYMIYKELREDGIIWTDARFDNIGILRKPNRPNLHGKDIYISPNSVGFIGEIKGKEINEGDFVIIDTDYIYREDDPKIEWLKGGFSVKFEKRWQQERQQKIAEEHKLQVHSQGINERGENDEK